MPPASVSRTRMSLNVQAVERYDDSGLSSIATAPENTRRPDALSNGTANATTGSPRTADATTGDTAGRPS